MVFFALMAIKAAKSEECVCEEGEENCPCMALAQRAAVKAKITIKVKPIILKKAVLVKKAKSQGSKENRKENEGKRFDYPSQESSSNEG